MRRMEGGALTPTSFRLATITLELVERRGLSLEAAFREALRKVGRREEGALRLAREALRRFAEADLLLKAHGLAGIPLRRRCAFRVAYAALAAGAWPVESIRALGGGLLSGRLRALLSRRGLEEARELASRLPPEERLAVENSFPPWLVKRLVKRLGLREAERLVKACARRVLWVRVNTLKARRGEVLSRLRRYATVREDRDFPELVELVGLDELPPELLKMMERGLIVPQDKGSVAVVHALEPRGELLVLDAAAAPGVKTSLIQQLSSNAAEVVAVDVSGRRVKAMASLLSRLGVRGVHIVQGDSRLMAYSRRYDRVLLDAPCTNTGAIASDPSLRLSLWREPRVRDYAALQAALLENSLKHLKQGGLLVYSTCSLLEEEGEEVVEPWLSFGYSLSPEGVIGEPGYGGFRCSSHVRRLYPHRHRTTGFFIARFTQE
ncbi:MAG: RsmB/NOP family class I SAM-dependent RNA methyltransferase [Thermoprotei archaeon]|nr:MAG: RsmB/NOP family class I SAM-dependent RNA methyltransferase [Thermoprotei archaeon]